VNRKHYYSQLSLSERTKRECIKKYNLDETSYLRLLADQKHVCAICGQPETTTLRGQIKRLSVDHDHNTGKVRGLLCSNCNVAIGKFKENTVVLEKAIAYLKLHGK
jgi:hypothetical protein